MVKKVKLAVFGHILTVEIPKSVKIDDFFCCACTNHRKESPLQQKG